MKLRLEIYKIKKPMFGGEEKQEVIDSMTGNPQAVYSWVEGLQNTSFGSHFQAHSGDIGYRCVFVDNNNNFKKDMFEGKISRVDNREWLSYQSSAASIRLKEALLLKMKAFAEGFETAASQSTAIQKEIKNDPVMGQEHVLMAGMLQILQQMQQSMNDQLAQGRQQLQVEREEFEKNKQNYLEDKSSNNVNNYNLTQSDKPESSKTVIKTDNIEYTDFEEVKPDSRPSPTSQPAPEEKPKLKGLPGGRLDDDDRRPGSRTLGEGRDVNTKRLGPERGGRED